MSYYYYLHAFEDFVSLLPINDGARSTNDPYIFLQLKLLKSQQGENSEPSRYAYFTLRLAMLKR